MQFFLLFILLFSSLYASSIQGINTPFPIQQQNFLFQKIQNNTPKKSDASIYQLHKGWNYLVAPYNGVDVITTFDKNKDIEIVALYEKQSKKWALYTAKHKYPKGVLFLKDIEPNVAFFVFATQKTELRTQPIFVTASCMKPLNTQKYNILIDSGNDKKITLNQKKDIGIKSRYISEYRLGLYSDTRVMLIYPKIQTYSKKLEKYGPAVPKVALEFTKEYEKKTFYIFDYRTRKCYKGIFPSKNTPPAPFLKEI
ncbi:hypothetical protein MNB_SM-3-798 [hydrothermal vent metagenome]|uniref:Uncharacterized protein n=1 Tax=hydrothermal vent metagenome TaxID=652676 RepID=A0A1W1D5K3_9ZZZZ